MRRIILVAALLLGGAISARADTDIYSGQGSNDDMNAAVRQCRQQWGEPALGIPPNDDFKKCMSQLGWTYVRTQHDGNWTEGGQHCHYILNGFGSECSAF